MKLSLLAEINESVGSTGKPNKPIITVLRFANVASRHDKQIVKNVFDPFVKMVDKEMRALKGKWNGADGGYDFTDPAKAEIAKDLMGKFNDEWYQMRKDYPEGERPNLDSVIAADYFERAKKKSALPR